MESWDRALDALDVSPERIERARRRLRPRRVLDLAEVDRTLAALAEGSARPGEEASPPPRHPAERPPVGRDARQATDDEPRATTRNASTSPHRPDGRSSSDEATSEPESSSLSMELLSAEIESLELDSSEWEALEAEETEIPTNPPAPSVPPPLPDER